MDTPTLVTAAEAKSEVIPNLLQVADVQRVLQNLLDEQVSIRATMAGYAPWTKKVYLSEPTTKVTAPEMV